MNIQEKKLFLASFLVFVCSSLFLVGAYLFANRVELPAVGGDNTEALIGSPRLINPLYASTNDADADLSALIFSGLMQWDPAQGYITDLAESIEVSEDHLQYIFHIKPQAKFSNGEPVQARDVVFTFSAIQDPAYRSPLASDFAGVKIEQADDRTVLFALKTPDPTFLQKLTVGILPENLWSDILAQNAPLASLNLQPIGSGPYAFQEFTKDKKGSIRTYTLKRNTHFYGTEPKIEKFIFKFYPDESSAVQALANKNVEGIGFIAFEHLESVENNHGVNLIYSPMPRAAVLYFNQQNPHLKSAAFRLAIAQAIDKQKILSRIFASRATVLHGPLFSGTSAYDAAFTGVGFDPAAAATALDTAGYTKPTGSTLRTIPTKATTKSTEAEPVAPAVLTLNLVTVASNEFIRVAEEIKEELGLLGIEITIQTVEPDHLAAEIITPQSFDLLLTANYGAETPDPYVFWHSSQIMKGGYNVARYQSSEADKILEKMRAVKTPEEQDALSRQFQTLLVKDLPAVFLYQSTYAFAEPKKIRLTPPSFIRIPSDRFANVEDWYIKTKQTLK